jgi:hypothetical protein
MGRTHGLSQARCTNYTHAVELWTVMQANIAISGHGLQVTRREYCSDHLKVAQQQVHASLQRQRKLPFFFFSPGVSYSCTKYAWRRKYSVGAGISQRLNGYRSVLKPWSSPPRCFQLIEAKTPRPHFLRSILLFYSKSFIISTSWVILVDT